MKKIKLFSLMLLLMFVACQEPPIIGTNSNEILENFEPKVENVSASIIGIIVDEDNDPVNDALIKLGSQEFTTDEYGHFFINDVTINSRGAVVKVEKAGFFNGSRRFFPKANTKNRLKIELLEKSFDQNFNSANGGNITLTSGAVIDFDRNSIQTISGSTYTGRVEVAAKWMDPTDLSTMDQMPGNLQGVNQQSEEVALASYGMIAVELQDETGAYLNIAEGSTAELRLPVPESMLANAPAEIPLWSYNEDFGLWLEESTATLENGFYVGEVSHFSFWNCDAPFPLVEFDLRLLDKSEMGVADILVTMEVVDMQAIIRSGYSDENGFLSGLIPANETLLLKVFTQCDDLLYSNTIGPFSEDIDLGEILIFPPELDITTITGSSECNGNSSTNSLVLVTFEDQTIYHYLNESSFSVSFVTCENTTSVSVEIIDLDEIARSSELTVMAGVSTDLGVIQTCEIAIDKYLRIEISGEEVVYYGGGARHSFTNPNATSISADPPNQAGIIYLEFYGKSVGDYSGLNKVHEIIDNSKDWRFWSSQFNDLIVLDEFIVTEYGEIGELVIGYFSGTIDGEPIEGDFKLKRY